MDTKQEIRKLSDADLQNRFDGWRETEPEKWIAVKKEMRRREHRLTNRLLIATVFIAAATLFVTICILVKDL